MIAKTTRHNNGMTTAKITAAFTLMVNAIIMEPKTINGLLSNRRNARFRPFCTWLASEVNLVIRVSTPTLSISA